MSRDEVGGESGVGFVGQACDAVVEEGRPDVGGAFVAFLDGFDEFETVAVRVDEVVADFVFGEED